MLKKNVYVNPESHDGGVGQEAGQMAFIPTPQSIH